MVQFSGVEKKKDFVLWNMGMIPLKIILQISSAGEEWKEEILERTSLSMTAGAKPTLPMAVRIMPNSPWLREQNPPSGRWCEALAALLHFTNPPTYFLISFAGSIFLKRSSIFRKMIFGQLPWWTGERKENKFHFFFNFFFGQV